MPKSVPEITSGPSPVGPYSIVAEANGLVFVSGQVALDPATGDRIDESVAAQARQAMTNIGAILGDLGLDHSDIVKTTIFLTDMADFGAVNEAYSAFFADDPPARSTVAVAALPLGFEVEIEVIAARREERTS
jgi:2-iminobutanoate/2-iminopropanoate deaminase